MHQKRGDLDNLAEGIEEHSELGDFYEKSFSESKKKSDEIRFYFCRSIQYKLLLEKAQSELNTLLSEFDIHKISFFKFCLLKTGRYNGHIGKLNKEIEEYSNKLKEFEDKRDNLYGNNVDPTLLSYNPREKLECWKNM